MVTSKPYMSQVPNCVSGFPLKSHLETLFQGEESSKSHWCENPIFIGKNPSPPLPSAPYSPEDCRATHQLYVPTASMNRCPKKSGKKSKTSANTNKNLLASFGKLLLMEEILHQLIVSLSHYLQDFINPRWCRISSINSIMASTWKNLKIDRSNFRLKNTCFSFGWEEVSSQEGNLIAAAASTNTKINFLVISCTQQLN